MLTFAPLPTRQAVPALSAPQRAAAKTRFILERIGHHTR